MGINGAWRLLKNNMNNYFINPEIKKGSLLIIFIMIIFFSASTFLNKMTENALKRDYSRSLGTVAARIIEKNPELEKDIMPLITKNITQEEESKGSKLLKQYGITTDLSTAIFPFINKTSRQNIINLSIIFIFLCLTLLFLNYIECSMFYKKVRKVTASAKKVLEGDYYINLNENTEGDFSKLTSSFNSMKDVIKNNIETLKKEKQFLVDLLSDISHQLKTPLSSIIVYNDIMLSKELPRSQEEIFLESNKNQLDKMNWLIKNLLKLARLDAKAVQFTKENQSLNETILESMDALMGKAYKENIEIKFHESGEIFLFHDRLWLEEAINNIIKNSIEHSSSGGKIDIYLSENPLFKRIIIEDKGEGISEDDLPHIFKRFYKSKSSKHNDSIGIGLALSKSIIEENNGLIEAQSTLGHGSKFIITFLNNY